MPQSIQKHKRPHFRGRTIKQTCIYYPVFLEGNSKWEGSWKEQDCTTYFIKTELIFTKTLKQSCISRLEQFYQNLSWTAPGSTPIPRHRAFIAAIGPDSPLHYECSKVVRNRRNWHLYVNDFKSPTRPSGLQAEILEPCSHLPWTKALPYMSLDLRSMVELSPLPPCHLPSS